MDRPVTTNLTSPTVSPNQSPPITESPSRNVDSVNPFTPSFNGHPLFNPVKLGARSSANIQYPRPPKPPENPQIPYFRHQRKIINDVKVKNSGLRMWDIFKIVEDQWKVLPTDQQRLFHDEYNKEKGDFTASMESYRSSSSYKAWVTAKSKAEDAVEEARTLSGQKSTRAKIFLDPAADEESTHYDDWQAKLVSKVRYQRNHELINKIFNDEVVPRAGKIITSNRLMFLKNHVQSLEMRKEKLDKEVKEAEERFSEKKRRLIESSLKFREDVKRFKY